MNPKIALKQLTKATTPTDRELSDPDYMGAWQRRIVGRIAHHRQNGRESMAALLTLVYADVLAWKAPEPPKPKGMPVDWTCLDNLKGIE